MHVFEVPGERVFVVLSAGNLATTQAVINSIQRDFLDAGSRLHTVNHLFEAAEHIGEISCKVQARHCETRPHGDVNLGASFIIGGQIHNKPPGIFMVYPEGNYIAPSPQNPYFQIGETKYGKPILDRIINHETTLERAARCALVSIDSTMRSNLSVGPPVEVTIIEADALKVSRRLRLDANSAYYQQLRAAWGEGLNRIFTELPRFEWEEAI
jgi:putative proteasome-type protease